VDDRSKIDPAERYPAEGFREFERLALEILDIRTDSVLERTRDAIEIRLPDSRDRDWTLVVLLTPDSVDFRFPQIDWTMGAYGPALSSTSWRRMSLQECTRPMDVYLAEHKESFENTLQECRHCEKRFLPSRMACESCQGCAERFEGVVF